MSNYTPTTEEVRAEYVRDHTRNFDSYTVGRSLTSEQEFYGARFDRWLSEVKARVWNECMLAHVEFRADQIVNPYTGGETDGE